jgi:hypothetical protein
MIALHGVCFNLVRNAIIGFNELAYTLLLAVGLSSFCCHCDATGYIRSRVHICSFSCIEHVCSICVSLYVPVGRIWFYLIFFLGTHSNICVGSNSGMNCVII